MASEDGKYGERERARYLIVAEEVGLRWIAPRRGVAGAGCGAAAGAVLLAAEGRLRQRGYAIYGIVSS